MALRIGASWKRLKDGTWRHFPWRGTIWNGHTLRWECAHHHRDQESAYRCARKELHDRGRCRAHTTNKDTTR
jgi:hypothetical protein